MLRIRLFFFFLYAASEYRKRDYDECPNGKLEHGSCCIKKILGEYIPESE